MSKHLNQWQTENVLMTKQSCERLLLELKRKHLDPVFQQLQGRDGSKLSFDDIIGVYHHIKEDYDARAVGARDAIAAAFFDFHPVRNRFLFYTGFVAVLLFFLFFLPHQAHGNGEGGREGGVISSGQNSAMLRA